MKEILNENGVKMEESDARLIFRIAPPPGHQDISLSPKMAVAYAKEFLRFAKKHGVNLDCQLECNTLTPVLNKKMVDDYVQCILDGDQDAASQTIHQRIKNMDSQTFTESISSLILDKKKKTFAATITFPYPFDARLVSRDP